MVTEALLEMHFHRALVTLFQDVFGARFLRLIKPSTRRESWVGFDQGWVRTELTDAQFLGELRAFASGSQPGPAFYVAYFLQFKVVQRMSRRSASCPPNYVPPYFRSKLSLSPNKTTGLSQHETLLRLSALNRADVSYACAMMFSPDDVYLDPDLDKLRIVPVASSPGGWATNEQHYICFQEETDPNPVWMSEPHPAEGLAPKEWVRTERFGRRFDAASLLEFIDEVRTTLTPKVRLRPTIHGDEARSPFPSSMAIVEFGKRVRETEGSGERPR